MQEKKLLFLFDILFACIKYNTYITIVIRGKPQTNKTKGYNNDISNNNKSRIKRT